MCIFKKLSNNRVRNNRLNDHTIHSKNALFDAHDLELQHLVTPYESNASPRNFC